MAEVGDLLINGTIYDPNTMTFRENREAERILRDEILEGEEPAGGMTMNDRLPAVALVLMRRDRPETTLDEALDLRPAEVVVDEVMVRKLNGKKKTPPTRVTPAKTGSPT
jgi:hypothetical protein